MGDLRWEIVNLNIAHYERLLETETNEERVRTLKSLLAEAQGEALRLGKEQLLSEEHTLASGNGADPAALSRDARRLRMKGEDYRAIANCCRTDAARDTYLCIARSYEVLAERAKGMLGQHPQRMINFG
jgi:hypothetical protein